MSFAHIYHLLISRSFLTRTYSCRHRLLLLRVIISSLITHLPFQQQPASPADHYSDPTSSSSTQAMGLNEALRGHRSDPNNSPRWLSSPGGYGWVHAGKHVHFSAQPIYAQYEPQSKILVIKSKSNNALKLMRSEEKHISTSILLCTHT